MRKVFKLQDLECANCAAKMEDAIKKIDGVNTASMSFMTQKLVIDAEPEKMDAILDEAEKICYRFFSKARWRCFSSIGSFRLTEAPCMLVCLFGPSAFVETLLLLPPNSARF